MIVPVAYRLRAVRHPRMIADVRNRPAPTRIRVVAGTAQLCDDRKSPLKLTTIDIHVHVDPSLPIRRPGDVLRTDFLLPRDLSIAALARHTGIRAQRIHGILTVGTPIGAQQAVRLAPVLGTSALYWMLLQAQYDLARAMANRTSGQRLKSL